MTGTTHRTHVSYIDRTRLYYAALGYPKPYVYAHHLDVPFAPLAKPLVRDHAWRWSPPRVPGATTRPNMCMQSGRVLSAIHRRTELFTDNLAWDKESTHTRDVESFLPLRTLAEAAASGRIGSVESALLWRADRVFAKPHRSPGCAGRAGNVPRRCG
jgi:hypothetical protein